MDVLGLVDVPIWLLLIGILLSLLYIYGTWTHNVFTKIGIRGPKPTFLIGNSGTLNSQGMVQMFDEWHNNYGDVFGIFMGSTPFVVVFDLDILKEVLVKQFHNFADRETFDMNQKPMGTGLFFTGGETWKRQRAILSPTFTSGKLRLMINRMKECSVTLSDLMVEHASNNTEADIKRLYGAFTMDVITSTAFSVEVQSLKNPDNLFVHYATKIFTTNFMKSPIFILATMFQFTLPLFRAMNFGIFPSDTVAFFKKTLTEMITQRKQDNSLTDKLQPDFLQLMLNAESNDVHSGLKRLSTDEIIGQGFLFFLAGYETTSTLLQYVSYSLATNPDVQEKLYQEILEQLGDEELTYEDINKLQYLDNVITESLRMYPSVTAVNRKVKETVTIKGITLEKGLAVFVPIFNIMRQESNYADPNSFKPERWEDKSSVNTSAYLPFGLGPRICIGMRLALLEVKVALVEILRKVKIVRTKDTPDHMTFFKNAMGMLRPEKPILLNLELR